MKTTIKMIGKDYDIVLNECKKVIEQFNYKKDGSACTVAKERIWKDERIKDINDAVEYFKNHGFTVEA